MAELSPAADAIMKAFDDYHELHPFEENWQGRCLAAALRELADRVAPEPPMIVNDGRSYEEAWTAIVHWDIRRKILSIANELEAS